MAKFAVGDRVAMPGVPVIVQVLQVSACTEEGCTEETFRFKDPAGLLGDDWAHSSEFELVGVTAGRDFT